MSGPPGGRRAGSRCPGRAVSSVLDRATSSVLDLTTRRRARHRPAVRLPAVRRVSVRLDLPAPPGAGPTPGQLTLTAPAALALPDLLTDGVAGLHVRALATFLAAVERAPAGAVLDVGAGIGLYALLAASYGTRPVRALEAVPDLAHVARQSAATSGLEVVVEEREIGGARGESLDAYVERTGLAPAVVHLGPAAAADVLSGAGHLLDHHRPWVVWTTATAGDGARARAAAAVLPRYAVHSVVRAAHGGPDDAAGDGRGTGGGVEVHLLTPQDPGPGFWQRSEQWSATLERGVPLLRRQAHGLAR